MAMLLLLLLPRRSRSSRFFLHVLSLHFEETCIDVRVSLLVVSAVGLQQQQQPYSFRPATL
jgi:hypothetical protein